MQSACMHVCMHAVACHLLRWRAACHLSILQQMAILQLFTCSPPFRGANCTSWHPGAG